MNLQVSFDYDTAAKVAELFAREGMSTAAQRMWQGLCHCNPYNRLAREKFADLHFYEQQAQFPRGSVLRGRFLLTLIGQTFPTPTLTAAYFDNLERLLQGRSKLSRPGAVIIGVGTGRCGSTTLSAAFAGLSNACSTHENPPLIYWEPQLEQLRFHMRRLSFLADYFSVVFEAAHWWLNALGAFFAEFSEGKVIGLHRDAASCVKSFVNVKGAGRGSVNHWAPPENGIWATTAGDPTYPMYPLPASDSFDPDAVKEAMIERYVTEYNHTLASMAARSPDRLMLIATQQLSETATLSRLHDFLDIPVMMPRSLNVGSTVDSDKQEYRF